MSKIIPYLSRSTHLICSTGFDGSAQFAHGHLSQNLYRKNPKISDTRKFAVITLKVEQDSFSLGVMHPKDAEGIANSVDPNRGAVWSGSALFALSKNLGTLRYLQNSNTLASCQL